MKAMAAFQVIIMTAYVTTILILELLTAPTVTFANIYIGFAARFSDFIALPAFIGGSDMLGTFLRDREAKAREKDLQQTIKAHDDDVIAWFNALPQNIRKKISPPPVNGHRPPGT